MKRFPVVHALAVVLAIFALGTAGTAGAITSYGALAAGWAPTGGTGTNTNFTIDTNSTAGVELGLKAIQRYKGDLGVTRLGNVYYVPTGYSTVGGTTGTTDPPRAWWNFDYSVSLGANPGNYDVYFGHDIDTGAGISMTGVTFRGGTLPMSGSLWQDSQNFGFVVWPGILQGGPSFDATKIADYSFILSVYNHGTVHDSSTFVAGTEMLVRVGTAPPVPIPGAVWLLGSGLVGLIGLKRRTNKRDKSVS